MKKNLFLSLFAILAIGLFTACADNGALKMGAECTNKYLPKLKGQRVALLANHTATVGEQHLVDMLVENKINVVGIFSPEHGFRGNADAGEHVKSSVDEKTGIPIWSLYDGKSGRPSEEKMKSFDVLVVDMQDVGLRFYTYYVTMIKMINNCAEYGNKVIVLDRPNPNGMYVDGPILDMEKYKSGVGWLPIPVVHGLTMGEIAMMAQGEGWSTKCDVEVIPCVNYTHQTRYELPIAPSPNLPNQHSIYLYPSTCLFEGTVCSLGRGTDFPFEGYGHPDYKGSEFTFTPRSVPGAKNPPLLDQQCWGVDLRGLSDDEIIAKGFDLTYVIDAYRNLDMGEKFFKRMFLLLTGVDYIKEMIMEGKSADEIRQMWQKDVEEFKVLRRKYLLYEE